MHIFIRRLLTEASQKVMIFRCKLTPNLFENLVYCEVLSETEKSKIITEILDSPEFRDSKRYQDLLQYLLKQTKSGTAPKESTIGIEFFNKESNFDTKEDPTVRVYLNNLRKKLDHYYLTSEGQHTYRLEIPRGHYQVEFIKVEKPIQLSPINKLAKIAIIMSTLAILVIIVSLLNNYWQKQNKHDINVNPIWTEFVKSNGRPTLIVFGDYFFLSERKLEFKKRNFIRNPDINSLDDFKEMIKKDLSLTERYVQSDFTFLRPSAVWGLTQVLKVLQNSSNKFSLKLASQFTVDDLKTNNIVFIGSFKTLSNLHKFLHIFGLEYSLSPNSIKVKIDRPDSTKIFSPTEIGGGNYEKDFAVIAKGAGPDGSTILLLLGFADSGVIEASIVATDQQMINTITKELVKSEPAQPFYFTLVVETEGLNQAIFKSKVEHFIQHNSKMDTSLVKSLDATKGDSIK
jgi:hypothetical protein